jgi:hypothetical protein
VAVTKTQAPWYLSLALDLAAKVEEAAAMARKALSEVTKSGDYKSTTSMPSKGVQCTL